MKSVIAITFEITSQVSNLLLARSPAPDRYPRIPLVVGDIQRYYAANIVVSTPLRPAAVCSRILMQLICARMLFF